MLLTCVLQGTNISDRMRLSFDTHTHKRAHARTVIYILLTECNTDISQIFVRDVNKKNELTVIIPL